MDINIADWFTGLAASGAAAIAGVIWKKADNAEKMSTRNTEAIRSFETTTERLYAVAEKLSALDASAKAEIKNLSLDVRRLEEAILRSKHD